MLEYQTFVNDAHSVCADCVGLVINHSPKSHFKYSHNTRCDPSLYNNILQPDH